NWEDSCEQSRSYCRRGQGAGLLRLLLGSSGTCAWWDGRALPLVLRTSYSPRRARQSTCRALRGRCPGSACPRLRDRFISRTARAAFIILVHRHLTVAFAAARTQFGVIRLRPAPRAFW